MFKLVFSNKTLNKALEIHIQTLPSRLPVQFKLITSKGQDKSMGKMALPGDKSAHKDQPFYLYGEGIWGGLVFNSLLLFSGFELDEKAELKKPGVLRSKDTLHKEHMSSLERMLFDVPADSEQDTQANNSPSQSNNGWQ